MQLDLTRYRQPLSHFGRTFQPSEVEQEGDAYRIVAPVRVDLEIHKDKDRFRLTGTARTELELACSRCLEPFRMPVDGPIRRAVSAGVGAATEDEREVAEEDLDTELLPRRSDRPERVAARAVLSGAADEAAVPGRLRRALPAVRDEPEYGDVRVRVRVGGPAARAAEGVEVGPQSPVYGLR